MMPAASIAELLGPEAGTAVVHGIVDDSRKVRAGDLYCACPGARHDGRDYIADALDRGAAAVAFESGDGWLPAVSTAVPLVPVAGLHGQLGAIAARFYHYPGRHLRVVGITGTNGKTSVSQLLAAMLNALGERCAAIGTLGYGFPPELTSTGYTTPDAISLQAILYDLLAGGARAVALEASSHGLQQGRLGDTPVQTAVFTNLTRDHLDYHGDFAAYGAAKASLFHRRGLQTAVMNIDDPFGAELAAGLDPAVACVTVSLYDRGADIHCRSAGFETHGVRAVVHTPWGDGELVSSLLGDFNLANLLAVIGVACSAGHALPAVLRAVRGLQPVEGRLQVVHDSEPMVVVDYAHTPDALAKALAACRRHTAGRLWLVFGCGGDRDRGKRPQMGAVAASGADCVVVTSDNPRNEDPQRIIAEVLGGMGAMSGAVVEVDRAAAIRLAVQGAAPGDCVLVAGKGHEDYQEIGGRRLPFKDSEQVRTALAARVAP